MNKLTKASIAGAAGIALLLGGAGTLAVWSDTEIIPGGTIASGTLEITASTGSWDDAPDLWVPGDTFTYTGEVEITATGDNLVAQLTIDTSAVTGDEELLDALVFDVTVSGANITQVGSSNVYTVTANNGPVRAQVEVEVTFPSSVSGLTAQGETVDLNAMTFTLTQVVPTP